ncbi:hypothetical protein RCC89_15285 [Cytophagaceae bacterium ABcell3]|nr:hypothetical protein RCC89_15285 [Cytophagaceae bacterium ABcell3]
MALENEGDIIALEKVYENKYAYLSYNKDAEVMVCEVRESYIPMGEFQVIFNAALAFIKENPVRKFIFDKRALKAFHQPSMEWYFTEWKPKVYELGLSVHRKILPPETWFRKCVEAGKHMIMTKNDTIIPALDIQYCESLKEALEA